MKSSTSDLYTLRPSPNIADADAIAQPPPVERLRGQIARGFATLRFEPGLERDFRRYLRYSGRISRASLIALSFVGMLVVLSVDRSVMQLPDVLLGPTRLLQVGVMMPAIVACGLFCWFRAESAAIEPTMLVLFAGMNIGMLGQRIVAAPYGFDVPAEMYGVTVVAMFSMARVRFRLMLPAALIGAVVAFVVELAVIRPPPNDYYHLFSASLLLAIGVMGGYSTEYFIRWTWLNGTLLRYLSRQDSLTGLLNRHALEEALDRAHEMARRERRGYALAMVDIDAFGAYNDHYGHQAGDTALRRIAGELGATVRRPLDVCGRFGGEEFVLLWWDADIAEAAALAEKVRQAIERARIAHEASQIAPWVTATVGLCHLHAADDRVELNQVLRRADELLYEGKNAGRNRVIEARYGVVSTERQRPLRHYA
ncbi:GGDEF domain-containing protein [Salinisphaera sp. T31B1]|uniref:GGDEF domain-containing protein n=1 Tax=Salinisphaera sp. T31B1 TaxID=727963 RepID=UPI003340365E